MIKMDGDPIEWGKSVTKTPLPKPKPSLDALRKAVTAITPNKGGRRRRLERSPQHRSRLATAPH